MPDTMAMLILRENDVIKVLMTSSSKGSPLKKKSRKRNDPTNVAQSLQYPILR